MEEELTLKRNRFLKMDYSRGFIADVGYEAMKYKRGYLESRLKVLTRHRQQDHYIHAGVIATMADHTAGYAAFTLVPEDHRILTIEFKINFLDPASGHVVQGYQHRVQQQGLGLALLASAVILAEHEAHGHTRRELVALAA